jgi:hypothetical protein
MKFIKTFKGYEDKTMDLDNAVNAWIKNSGVNVLDIKTVLSHEPNSRAGSGDLLYTVMYEADEPV